jgi:hypothetical protein
MYAYKWVPPSYYNVHYVKTPPTTHWPLHFHGTTPQQSYPGQDRTCSDSTTKPPFNKCCSDIECYCTRRTQNCWPRSQHASPTERGRERRQRPDCNHTSDSEVGSIPTRQANRSQRRPSDLRGRSRDAEVRPLATNADVYDPEDPVTRGEDRSHRQRRASYVSMAKEECARRKEETAHRAGIPAGYSHKNWDPSEEPIMLLGSVFDANSLGKWIYD